MAWIDPKGRVLGKISVLDLGALIILIVAIASVLFFPGKQVGSVVQLGNTPTVPVEVDMIIRGISTRSLDPFVAGGQANLIIRNQTYGQVDVLKVEDVSREIPLVMPDGEIRFIPDPEPFRKDVVMTLQGQGQKTDDSIVLGNNKVKIGMSLELETFDYNIRGTVMEVRLLA